MSFINANIPPIGCYIRKEFLFNEEEHHGEYEEGFLFGVTSLMNKTLLFNFMSQGGGHFCRLPIHAFCHIKNAPKQTLNDLVTWNNFSYNIGVIQYDYLTFCKAKIKLRDNNVYLGDYLFTVDYAHPDKNLPNLGVSEDAYDHKSANVYKLDNGNFAIQPNNKVLYVDASYIEPYKDIPRWKAQTKDWRVSKGDWKTKGDYFYDIEESKKDYKK
jgi:hypothetical protein